jgi:hypothetical protein
MAIHKTSEQRRREQVRRYREEYARLKVGLREIGFICEGSLLERWMRCGKPNCACSRQKARRHGPYFQLSWKEEGKTMSRRLSPEQAALYRQWVANRQRLQFIIGKMQQVSGRAQRHLLHPEELKKGAAKSGDMRSSHR